MDPDGSFYFDWGSDSASILSPIDSVRAFCGNSRPKMLYLNGYAARMKSGAVSDIIQCFRRYSRFDS